MFSEWSKVGGYQADNGLDVTRYDTNVLLEKSGVTTHVKDLLTKLLENRPENVVEFIAE